MDVFAFAFTGRSSTSVVQSLSLSLSVSFGCRRRASLPVELRLVTCLAAVST